MHEFRVLWFNENLNFIRATTITLPGTDPRGVRNYLLQSWEDSSIFGAAKYAVAICGDGVRVEPILAVK